MSVDASPGLEGATFVAPKTGPAAPSSTTSRAVNGAADAVETVGRAELAAIETVNDVANGEWGTPELVPGDPEPRPLVVPIPTEGGTGSASAPANNGAEAPPNAQTAPPAGGGEAPPAGVSESSGEERLPYEQRAREVQIDQQRDVAFRIIEAANKAGVYETPEAQTSAKITIETSTDDIKATMTTLRITKGDKLTPEDIRVIEKTYNDLSQNVFVTSGGKTYLLSALEAERTGASEVRQKQIDEIITGGTYELSFDAGKFADAAVSREIDSLKRQIEERKAKGERVETYEEILNVLVTADSFKGKARAFVVDVALKRLWASGLSENPAELDEIISQSAGVVNGAEAEILKHAEFVGFSPKDAKGIAATIREGDFAVLQRIGYFAKPGVGELFFGRELTDAEMAKVLGLLGEKRKFGKAQALMVLLMALVGVTQATRQAVMGELPRQR